MLNTERYGLTALFCLLFLSAIFNAQAASISCPTGYIPVPGNSELGTQDFCVAKYEMKKSSASQPVSQAAGLPWTNLTATEAFNQCQAITVSGFDGKFQLISNPQWMTVARNLESVNANWSSGVVGNGMFARGHSDSNPNVALSVSNSNDPYDQTGNNSGQAANSGWEQKRRNQLTNGEYIWDLGGNVHELVDWHLNDNSYTAPPSGCTDAGGSSGWNEMNETVTGCSAQDKDIKPKNTSFTSATGMGQWYGGNAGVAFRGGKMSNGIETGIFQLAMYYGKANGDVGFRCSYTPKGAEPVNQAPVATADSFSLKDTDGVTELDILANDTDEDKASLAITITNQSGLGGSATVAGQKLSYTPQAGYAGEDWVEYRLADKQGLTSEVVRVTIAIATTPSADALRQGLVVEYLFEDLANPGKDTSPNTKHATAQGSPTVVDGKIGKALLVDELSDVLEGVPGFNKGQMTTFNLWFKTTQGGYLMQQSYWQGNNIWEMFPSVRSQSDSYEGELGAWAVAWNPNRNDMELVKRGHSFKDNQWHMLTIITDGNSGKAYVDGQLFAEDSSSNGPANWLYNQTSSRTQLGGGCTYGHNSCRQGDGFFNGLIDNYRMYNRALSHAEITLLLNETEADSNQAPATQADFFSLKETDGITELDILANDTDEDKASLVIAITNQSTLGGNAVVVDQKLRYTPQAGYTGEDWVEYQLTDNQGLQSTITRVKLHILADTRSTVFADGLVVEYLFEDSQQPGKDSSVNGSHANSEGQPTLVEGKYGLALEVNELTDVLDNVPGFNKGQMTTFNLWFKTTQGGYLMQQSYWQGNNIWEMFPSVRSQSDSYEGELGAWAVAWNPNRNDMELVKRGHSFKDNQWHMLTIITDGNSGKAYVDGQLFAEDSSSNGPANWLYNQTSSRTQLGGGCTYGHNSCRQGDGFFNGLIDNYRMYNRAMTPLEIQKLYREDFSGENQPPIARKDTFSLTDNGSTLELNVLLNDWDEARDDLSISIMAQNTAGGTASVSGKMLSYVPKANYEGEDWIEYQLTDKHGLKSNAARVTLDIQKYKPKAAVATVSPRQNLLDVDKQLITISHDNPGNTSVWFQLHNIKTGHVTDYIEYTNPFYIYNSARIFTIVKGENYQDSDAGFKEYVMCQQTDVCGTSHKEKHFLWADSTSQQAVTTVKVNQPVSVKWEVENVRYCEETTPGQTTKKPRSGNGITPAYTFTQPGSINTRWQCFNSHGGQTFPTATSTDYRTLPLQVEKLDAPTTLTHNQQGVTVTLDWDKVNYASHYQLQYQKDGGTWQTTTVNGQTTQLPFTQGTYHFRLSACIPTTCDNVSQVLTKTINVAESPFIIHTLEWENAPITVGQTPKLIWNIEHAVQCIIQGQTYSHNQHHTFPVPYQPTVIKPVLTCNKTTGGTHEAISIPESLWLQVNKLSAPANLRKQ